MANKILLVAQREYVENVRTKTFWIGIFIVPLLIAAMVGGGALLQKFKEVQKYAVLDLGGQGLLRRAEQQFRDGDLSALWKSLASPTARQELQELAQQLGPVGNAAEPNSDQLLKVYDWLARQDQSMLDRFAELETSRKFTRLDLTALGLQDLPPDACRERLNKLVQDGTLFAYIVLGPQPNETLDGFEYVSNNLTDEGLRRAYESALSRLVQKDRITAANIPPRVAEHIQQRVQLAKKQVDASGATTDVKGTDVGDKWAPVGFVYFLWIAILSIANLLLTNTVEEKSNRIIEVLLSSVSPTELMQGKILGIAATGLTIIGTWVGFALIAGRIAPSLLGDSGGFLQLAFAAIGNSRYLLSFVGYFIAGYLLYASILVAIGSVCNSLKEAQNLMQPVMMLLFVPLVAMVFVTQEPNGTVARVLSFVPPFTPFTMMNRAGGPPETWEYVVTSVLLLGSIWFCMRAAGKVFRIGVLMTGNPPKLKEILGWLRER